MEFDISDGVLKKYNGPGGDLVIPGGVTSIGESAFYNCKNLTSVTIPDSVTYIEKSAFLQCENLSSVEIPASVTSIGELVFSSCKSLRSINVDGDNQYHKSIDGVLFNKNGTLLYTVPAGKNLTNYAIPNGVISVGDYAFSRCKSLTSVEIPASVTSIGNNAFYDCESLTAITIPASVTSIANSAFSGCKSLTGVNVDGNNQYYQSIDGVLFNKNGTLLFTVPIGKALTSYAIPNGVTSIGGYAFHWYERLTSIEIPASVTSIGNGAFCFCTGLTSVMLPASVSSIGDYAFSSCKNLTSVIIPSSAISIGKNAFDSNTKVLKISDIFDISDGVLKKYKGSGGNVVIPAGITSIGDYAFYKCEDLTSVDIPDSVTSIGEGAFSFCVSLTNLEIPASVTSIGKWTFSLCVSLTSVGIPASVTSIGNSAFIGCAILTSITIPASVTSIEEGAFHNCGCLTSINIDGNNQYYKTVDGILFNKDGTLLHSVPAGKALTSYTIPNGVTSIGEYSFDNCKNLTSVEIPDSVISIGKNAFFNCESLTSVRVPASVASIGKNAFSCCGSLAGITVDNANQHYKTVDGILFNKEGTLLHSVPAGKALTSYTIPNGVTSIGESAFNKCENLKSIDIPVSVTSIGGYAFSNCKGLTSVFIPSTATSIAKNAFDSTTEVIKTFDIRNGVLEKYNGPGGAVVIPNGITSIGSRVFYGYESLTSVDIPDSVKSIGNWAFWGCTHLKRVSIASPDTSIGNCAFYGTGCKNAKAGKTTEGGCYIATAVYGSYTAPSVMVLRRFRDEVLEQSLPGRVFVRCYYRFSPPIARRLEKARCVNRIVRRILDALVGSLKAKRRW